MGKLDIITCNSVLDYLDYEYGYVDKVNREVVEGLTSMLKSLLYKQEVSGVFTEYFQTNKKVKDLKNEIKKLLNESVDCVYTQYSMDFIKAGQVPLTLKQIIQKSKEKNQEIKKESGKSRD